MYNYNYNRNCCRCNCNNYYGGEGNIGPQGGGGGKPVSFPAKIEYYSEPVEVKHYSVGEFIPLPIEEIVKESKKELSAQDRKDRPLARGLLDYFPDALMEVAYTSKIGNDQHNPGQEMHWAKEKSTDHADCILRHLIDRGTMDTDGVRHSAKVAWRALALLQTELDKERSSGLAEGQKEKNK